MRGFRRQGTCYIEGMTIISRPLALTLALLPRVR